MGSDQLLKAILRHGISEHPEDAGTATDGLPVQRAYADDKFDCVGLVEVFAPRNMAGITQNLRMFLQAYVGGANAHA